LKPPTLENDDPKISIPRWWCPLLKQKMELPMEKNHQQNDRNLASSSNLAMKQIQEIQLPEKAKSSISIISAISDDANVPRLKRSARWKNTPCADITT
jgi:uncharacterized protein (UPF0147 family)